MESRQVVDMRKFLKDYSKVLNSTDRVNLYKRQQLQVDFANEVRLLALGEKKEPSNWEDFFTVILSYPDLIEINGRYLLPLFAGLIKEGRSVEDCEKVMQTTGMEIFLQNYHRVEIIGCDHDLIQKAFQSFLTAAKGAGRSVLLKNWLPKFKAFYPSLVQEFA